MCGYTVWLFGGGYGTYVCCDHINTIPQVFVLLQDFRVKMPGARLSQIPLQCVTFLPSRAARDTQNTILSSNCLRGLIFLLQCPHLSYFATFCQRLIAPLANEAHLKLKQLNDYLNYFVVKLCFYLSLLLISDRFYQRSSSIILGLFIWFVFEKSQI